MMMLYLIQELSGDCERRIRRSLGASRFKLIKQSNELVRFVMERLEVFQWREIKQDDWPRFY